MDLVSRLKDVCFSPPVVCEASSVNNGASLLVGNGFYNSVCRHNSFSCHLRPPSLINVRQFDSDGTLSIPNDRNHPTSVRHNNTINTSNDTVNTANTSSTPNNKASSIHARPATPPPSNVDHKKQPVVIMGAGRLGESLINFPNFSTCGLQVVGLFDIDPKKVGLRCGKLKVEPVHSLSIRVTEFKVQRAIIAVPPDGAQEAANALVRAGIRVILNYSPATVQVPKSVVCESIDPANQFLKLVNCTVDKQEFTTNETSPPHMEPHVVPTFLDSISLPTPISHPSQPNLAVSFTPVYLGAMSFFVATDSPLFSGFLNELCLFRGEAPSRGRLVSTPAAAKPLSLSKSDDLHKPFPLARPIQRVCDQDDDDTLPDEEDGAESLDMQRNDDTSSVSTCSLPSETLRCVSPHTLEHDDELELSAIFQGKDAPAMSPAPERASPAPFTTSSSRIMDQRHKLRSLSETPPLSRTPSPALPSPSRMSRNPTSQPSFFCFLLSERERERLRAEMDQGNEQLSAQGPGGNPRWGDEDPVVREFVRNARISRRPNVRWSSVAGLEFAKRALQETLETPMAHDTANFDTPLPWSSMLLYGPPGCGKTLLAKAVATEMFDNYTFFHVLASDLISERINTERVIEALFDAASKAQPSVLFIDNVDVLCRRGERYSDRERKPKFEFLRQLDKMRSMHDSHVFVLGATNLPWELDVTVLRHFEKRVLVPLPNADARKRILEVHIEVACRSSRANMCPRLTEDNYAKLVRATDHYSASDIALVVKTAMYQPYRRKGKATGSSTLRNATTEDFLKSVKEVRPTLSSEIVRLYERFTSKFGESDRELTMHREPPRDAACSRTYLNLYS